nr:immunoglobulin light chain junction region [Macaca mulatta]
CTIGHSSGDVF